MADTLGSLIDKLFTIDTKMWNNQEEIYKIRKMDFEKYKRIVDEGSEYKCPSIEPQGINEPLLVKDFEKYVK